MRGGADGAERLLVVHAQRPEQADRAERAVRDAVGRADERELAQPRLVELLADAANGRRGSSRCASTSSSAARFSSASIRLRYAPISSARISSSRPAVPPTKSCRSSSAACSKAPRIACRNARSRGRAPGSSKASLTAREPMRAPATRSSGSRRPRSRAPGRPAREGERTSVTPPVEVITTTITTSGWSSSTSTWRTVAASSAGAETSASSRVTCDSISVVAWSASSTSARAAGSSSGKSAGPRLGPLEQLVDVEAIAATRSGRGPPRCAGASAGRAARAPRARSGRSTARRRGRPLDERLRADRLPGRDVLLDDGPEDVALPLGEQDLHGLHGRRRRVRRGAARSRRRRGSGPRGVSVSGPSRRARRARGRSSRSSASGSTTSLEAGERQRLVEPQAEHHALGRARRRPTAAPARARRPLARARAPRGNGGATARCASAGSRSC